MANLTKVRILLETIRGVAVHLNDDEIAAIGIILSKALERLEKESTESEEN